MIFVSIGLASLTSDFGAREGFLSMQQLTDVGMFFVFFLYGIGMSFSTMLKGMSQWRLHLLVHCASFLIYPLFVLAAVSFLDQMPFEKGPLYPTLRLGVFYLAVLPSTVSSSVVMVSIARGNIPAAILNASLSSLLAVFLTPFWVSFYLQTDSQSFEILPVIYGLCLVVFLPIIAGMALHHWLGDFEKRYKRELKWFDQTFVLLIVYSTFSKSFANDVFSGFTPATLITLAFTMSFLFFSIYGIIGLCCRVFRFNREDTITALFCGSKKSMTGAVLAKIIFAGDSTIGVILLPLLFYHALQLIFVSQLAMRKSRQEQS